MIKEEKLIMNNNEIPGIIAICKIVYPVKEEVILEELKEIEAIILNAFRETFDKKEIRSHITTSSLKFSSIAIEVSIWVAGIVSFLKLYPSVKKGLLELIEDTKILIDKTVRKKYPQKHIETILQTDLISIVEEMPHLGDILLMGLDLYQLYTLSQSNESYVKDAKYLIVKYSEQCAKLAINPDNIFCLLLKGDLDGLKETERLLAKFGKKYVSIFNLGVQIMNFGNALSHCYRSREYKIVNAIRKQVIHYMNELGFSEKVIHEVERIPESIKDLILLSPEEFEEEKSEILKKLMNISIKSL